MTTEGILDTLRRSPELERTWDETAAALGATLRGLDPAGVRKLTDGVARIAREQESPAIRACSRMLLAVLRGASNAFAEAVTQQLTDLDLIQVKGSVIELATALDQLRGVARAKQLVEHTRWSPGRVTKTLDELIEEGFAEDLAYKGRTAGDTKARFCRLLPLGQRLVQLHGTSPRQGGEMVVLPALGNGRKLTKGPQKLKIEPLSQLRSPSVAKKLNDEVQV